MKKAKIYYKHLLAGNLVEDEHGFTFTYDTSHVSVLHSGLNIFKIHIGRLSSNE